MIMAKKDERAYFHHILQETVHLVKFLDEAEDNLAADTRSYYAIIRAFEIIGEASKRISAKTKTRFPDVPWRLMVDMRNILAHDYLGINEDEIKQTILDDIPKLGHQIKEILTLLDKEHSDD